MCVSERVRALLRGWGNTLQLEQSGITRLLPWQRENGNFPSNRRALEMLGRMGISPWRLWECHNDIRRPHLKPRILVKWMPGG